MIIDSHLHLTKMTENETHEDALVLLKENMVKNNIDKAIIIADNIIGSDCADTDTLLKLLKTENNFYMVGSLLVLDYSQADLDKFDNLLKEKKIIALKLFPGHDPYYPTDARCEPIYELCLKHDCPIIIHTGINIGDEDCAKYNDPKHIVEVAKKYSKLKIVIAHYFWPKMEYCHEITKPYDNILFDTSAMADIDVVEATGGIEKVKNILEQTIKEKPNGVMFGTDYPCCEIKPHVDLINSSNISQEEKEKVFSGNSIEVFKIK